MSNHSIKAVLLDYGGVFADEGFQNSLLTMARGQGLDEDRMMNVARSAVYDCGFILGGAPRMNSGNGCAKVPD